MKLAFTYDEHHSAGTQWDRRDLKDWVTDIFEAPSIRVGPRCTTKIRGHVEKELLKEGWAPKVQLNHELGLSITAGKDELGFQLQTGNMARAFYDLLKLQYLFQAGRIELAAMAVPTQDAAKSIGSNLAYAERVIRELQLFDRVITLPILVIAFE